MTQLKKLFGIAAVTGVLSALNAAPLITVDSTAYDLGTIREGSGTSLKKTFIVRNSGTDTLRIANVKPG